jgi:hypothetical protein
MAVPPGLTVGQRATWRAIVRSRPVDWFDGGSAPLLVAYCRGIAAQTMLAARIDAFDPEELATGEGIGRYDKLLALDDRQTRKLVKLATAMRLSQHARRSIDAAATAARDGQSSAKLWQRDG